MKLEKKLEMILNDVFWRCSDCENIYSIDIKNCPNEILDSWIISNVVKPEDFKELE